MTPAEVRRIGAGVRWKRERPGSRAWLDLGKLAVELPVWRWLPVFGAVQVSYEEERLSFVEDLLAKNPDKNREDVWLLNKPHVRYVSSVRDDGALLFQGSWGLAEDAAGYVPALWSPWASAWLREICREAWQDPRLVIHTGRDSCGPFWRVEATRADTRNSQSWATVRDVVRMPACREEVVAWLRCLAVVPRPLRREEHFDV